MKRSLLVVAVGAAALFRGNAFASSVLGPLPTILRETALQSERETSKPSIERETAKERRAPGAPSFHLHLASTDAFSPLAYEAAAPQPVSNRAFDADQAWLSWVREHVRGV